MFLRAVILCFVMCLDNMVMSYLVVTVDVTVDAQVELDPCVGGDVALTDTSVQLQYREVYNSSVAEWMTLDVIRISTYYNQTRNLTHFSSCDVLGVQFRLLQLEHGGFECNCWEFVSLEARVSDNLYIYNSMYQCASTESKWQNLYCGGSVLDARGLITNVLYLYRVNSAEWNGSCPGDSNIELISNKGPPLPSCSTATPRL